MRLIVILASSNKIEESTKEKLNRIQDQLLLNQYTEDMGNLKQNLINLARKKNVLTLDYNTEDLIEAINDIPIP